MINYGVNCVDVRLVQPHRHNFDLKSHFEENFQYFGVDGVGGTKAQQTQLFCWKLSVEINQRVLEPSLLLQTF